MLQYLKKLKHLFYALFGAIKYNFPSEKILVIGVTGTSGKSTVIYMLRQLLEKAGFRVGSLSTIDFYVNGKLKMNDKKMTMLGKTAIQNYLREMVDSGCDIAIIETSSQGVVQSRHRFINYDLVNLTNLYPEHIEAHGCFENYKKAKLDFFSYVVESKRKILNSKRIEKIAIVNGDSEYADEFLNFNFEKKFIFGKNCKNNKTKQNLFSTDCCLLADKIKISDFGLSFCVENYNFNAQMYGEYNIMNILNVISIARSLKIDWKIIQQAVSDFKIVPGRIEFISEAEKFGFKVIVDYAFEPVAMAELYKVVDLLKPKRIIQVFGSTGGGRDKSRRKILGEMAGKKANICIVTDEDPYDDDPMNIINEVARAVELTGKKENIDLFKILNREKAIQKAIDFAKEGDLILVTGKGSEQAMCTANKKMVPWDDRKIVINALKKR